MASFIKPIFGSFKRILLMNLVSSPLNIPGLNFSFLNKEYLKKLLEDESWIQLTYITDKLEFIIFFIYIYNSCFSKFKI